MDNTNEDFSGVFMFTNPTDKERKYLWNNKEYTFPPMSTVPLIIPSETLENIQEIRKRFAYRMAQERWYESDDYKRMKEMGGGYPPLRDDKVLEPLIQECLKPLPVKRAAVKEGKKLDDEHKYKATKAGFTASPAELFREDENREAVGEMPDR